MVKLVANIDVKYKRQYARALRRVSKTPVNPGTAGICRAVSLDLQARDWKQDPPSIYHHMAEIFAPVVGTCGSCYPFKKETPWAMRRVWANAFADLLNAGTCDIPVEALDWLQRPLEPSVIV